MTECEFSQSMAYAFMEPSEIFHLFPGEKQDPVDVVLPALPQNEICVVSQNSTKGLKQSHLIQHTDVWLRNNCILFHSTTVLLCSENFSSKYTSLIIILSIHDSQVFCDLLLFALRSNTWPSLMKSSHPEF